jgi:hypothetical protein
VHALKSSLETQFPPGTNLKGAVEGANWCFTLPRLALGQVLSLGRPSSPSLVTLSRLADNVAVWAKVQEHDRLNSLIAKEDLQNVVTLRAEGSTFLPAPESVIDTVLVAKPGFVRSELGGAKAQAEIERVLKPGGLLYVESYATVERWLRREKTEAWFDRSGGLNRLWLAPAFEEVLLAAPLGDSLAIEYVERFFLKPIFRRALFKRPRRVMGRSLLMSRFLRRRGLLVSGAGDEQATGPPAYVRALAAGAGAAVDGLRWALAAPGDHSSQKVLLFLFGKERGEPESVVKITRDARYNFRLENEWRALTLLEKRGIGQDGTCPSPLFLGHEAGLAVLGETALNGVPFLRRTEAGGGWQAARKVVEWLVTLGSTTAHQPESAPIVAARLRGLLDQFDEVYRPPKEIVRFLGDQVAAVGESGNGMRLVFQHGDPGPWNLLVTPKDQPAFLDWEAADPEGVPLWDIFHFLRSFGFSLLQERRRQDALQSFADQVLADSELNRFLVETAARYCAETSLSPKLVEPLFYLCWMHRAVKEASRLPHDRLHSGRYVNLLSLAVERRNAPGLRRLFSIPAMA